MGLDSFGWQDRVKDVPGDFAEFGCYEGYRTKPLADRAAHEGRQMWAWDTFEGMPDDGYIVELDNSNPPGKWKSSTNVVADLTSHGSKINCVVGKFSDTIPEFEKAHPDIHYAFVHIDCDHYHAYRRVYEHVVPRMSPGGIIRIDDYGDCKGAKKATDEFLAASGKTLTEGDKILF